MPAGCWRATPNGKSRTASWRTRLAQAYAHGASAIAGRAKPPRDWPAACCAAARWRSPLIAARAGLRAGAADHAGAGRGHAARPLRGGRAGGRRGRTHPGRARRAGEGGRAAGAAGRHHPAQRLRGGASRSSKWHARKMLRLQQASMDDHDRQARTGRRPVRGNGGARRARLRARHVRQVGHQGAAARRGAVRRSARLGRPAGGGGRGDHARGRSDAGRVPAQGAGGRRGQPARGRRGPRLPRRRAAAPGRCHGGARRLQGRDRRRPASPASWSPRARPTRREPAARLGLRGTARVYGEPVTLFFYLLRRPITALRQWTGL